MKLLLIGKNGNVGHAIHNLLLKGDHNFEFVSLSRLEMDLLNPNSILQKLNEIKPEIIINSAAYTAVDAAEKNSVEAMMINSTAPEIISKWSSENNAFLIHFSTDYVFDGYTDTILYEDSPTNPLNIYGKSKLEGENKILLSGAKSLIFRTSWLFSPSGNNFFNTMLKLGQSKKSLKIVNDQVGSPTYSYSLAYSVLECIKIATQNSFNTFGIYHIHNQNFTTWYLFAKLIFEMARQKGIKISVEELEPITTEQYNAPASRPKNTKLSCDKLKMQFGITLPTWEEDLELCFFEYINNLGQPK